MRCKSQDIMDRIVEYVDRMYFDNDITPSLSEIADHLGVNKSTVSRYVAEMKQKGILSVDNGWRQIKTRRIERSESAVKRIPIVGDVACGTPMFAEHNLDGYLTFSASFLGDGDFFALKTKGDSMINVGIDDGDYVIVRRQSVANDGEIVVALVDDSATLKTFKRDTVNKRFILHPENDAMQDMYFDRIQIQGVVNKIIKDI